MALRIGTVNVQLFTDVQAKAAAGDFIGAAAAVYALSADTAQQAKGLRLVERILDAPYDVVCFQEMWSLPAWSVIRDALKAGGFVFAAGSLELRHNLPTPCPVKKWTDRDHVTEELAKLTGPVGSGLAVASRLPPVPFLLPGDTTSRTTAFGQFERAGGDDGLADKGGFVFVVDVPGLGRTVVATSHLQADYSLDGGSSYQGIRQAQLEQWDDLIGQVAVAARTTRIVACGDLNVRSEPVTPAAPGAPPRTQEYLDTFGWKPNPPPVNKLGIRLVDGWTLSSPEESALTNQDRQRLDVVLGGSGPRSAVVRHIMLALNLLTPSDPTRLEPTPIGRGALPARGGDHWESDHWGVNAIVGPVADHHTPAQARHMKLDPGNSDAWIPVLDNGAPRWLLLTEPGTYRVELKVPTGKSAHFLVFEPRDLSAPFAWLDPGGRQPDPLPASKEFPGRTIEVHRVGGPLTPLYVRAQADGDATVNATLIAYRHAGITPDEAIVIDPGDEHRLTVAPNQYHIWVELQPDGPPLDPAIKQTVHLDVRGDVAEIDVLDVGLGPLVDAVTVSGQPTFAGTRTTVKLRGPQVVKVRIRTARVGGAVRARWDTDLKVLHGALYEGMPASGSWDLKLHVDDETGVDSFGADEITVAGQADGVATVQVVEDDSDTGENISLAAMDPIRFVGECAITITEDDPDGDAVGGVTFPQDLPAGVSIPARSRRRPVRVGSGTYALFYNLSGWLRRKNL